MKRGWMTAILLAAPLFLGAQPLVKDGDRLALYGDSITQQKAYTVMTEAYLRACVGMKDLQVFQFGRGGETAAVFLSRLPSMYALWKPTVATEFYGMNDARELATRPQEKENYRQSVLKMADTMKEGDVRFILLSPGAIDADFFNRPDGDRNSRLKILTDVCREIASERKLPFVDMHAALLEAQKAAKAKLGKKYPLGGGDGVHPGQNGHLVMTGALLRGLGLEGEVARIELDYAAGTAKVGAGHRVLSSKPGKAELESERYPFVFSEKDGTDKITEFIPFNEELNRFILRVSNFPAEKGVVSFGAEKKTFLRAELEKGVNLAAAFPCDNPFALVFNKLIAQIRAKQVFETWIALDWTLSIARKVSTFNASSEAASSIATLNAECLREREKMDAAIRALLVPVRYTIEVVPEP